MRHLPFLFLLLPAIALAQTPSPTREQFEAAKLKGSVQQLGSSDPDALELRSVDGRYFLGLRKDADPRLLREIKIGQFKERIASEKLRMTLNYGVQTIEPQLPGFILDTGGKLRALYDQLDLLSRLLENAEEISSWPVQDLHALALRMLDTDENADATFDPAVLRAFRERQKGNVEGSGGISPNLIDRQYYAPPESGPTTETALPDPPATQKGQ